MSSYTTVKSMTGCEVPLLLLHTPARPDVIPAVLHISTARGWSVCLHLPTHTVEGSLSNAGLAAKSFHSRTSLVALGQIKLWGCTQAGRRDVQSSSCCDPSSAGTGKQSRAKLAHTDPLLCMKKKPRFTDRRSLTHNPKHPMASDYCSCSSMDSHHAPNPVPSCSLKPLVAPKHIHLVGSEQVGTHRKNAFRWRQCNPHTSHLQRNIYGA